jgi:hypothetical protein
MPHGPPDAPGLAIRRVALDTLHLDPANAREHGPENMEAIVGSLKRFQQVEPLVVQKSSGLVSIGNFRPGSSRSPNRTARTSSRLHGRLTKDLAAKPRYTFPNW